MKPFQVSYPFSPSTIAQNFGDNANISYARGGLKGHTGTDFGVPWGTPIPATADAYVYSLMNVNDPILMGYRAVFTLVEGGDGFVYEISYGHVSTFVVEEGDFVKVGDVLAYVGNTGDVFSGNHEVTEAEKDAGSHAGAHLHFQVRKCVYTDTIIPNTTYIYGSHGGRVKWNGKYIQVVDYDNGYNGCIAAPYNGLVASKTVINTPTDPAIAELTIERNTLATKALALAQQYLAVLQAKLAALTNPKK